MKFEVYRSGKQWRWRLKARNGNIIATSGESYTRRVGALKGVRSVASVWAKTDLLVQGEGGLYMVEQISKTGSLCDAIPRPR